MLFPARMSPSHSSSFPDNAPLGKKDPGFLPPVSFFPVYHIYCSRRTLLTPLITAYVEGFPHPKQVSVTPAGRPAVQFSADTLYPEIEPGPAS